MSIEQLKILASAYALDNFTVEDLVDRTGSKNSTVRSWLRRSKGNLIEETGSTLQNTGGRPAKEWRVRPEKIDEIELTLKQLSGRFLESNNNTYIRPKQVLFDFDDISSFEIAENYIEEASYSDDDETIFEYTDIAKEWVNARLALLEEMSDSSHPIPESIYIRIEEIHLQANKIAWNVDKFVGEYSQKSISEISNDLFATLIDNQREPSDRTSDGLKFIRWRSGISREQQFRHFLSLLYGDVLSKIRCSFLYILSKKQTRQNYIRYQLFNFIDDAGVQGMVAALEIWIKPQKLTNDFLDEFSWVLAGLESERKLMSTNEIGNWAARIQKNDKWRHDIKLSLEAIFLHSANGIERNSLPSLLERRKEEIALISEAGPTETFPDPTLTGSGIVRTTGLGHFFKSLTNMFKPAKIPNPNEANSKGDETSTLVANIGRFWVVRDTGDDPASPATSTVSY